MQDFSAAVAHLLIGFVLGACPPVSRPAETPSPAGGTPASIPLQREHPDPPEPPVEARMRHSLQNAFTFGDSSYEIPEEGVLRMLELKSEIELAVPYAEKNSLRPSIVIICTSSGSSHQLAEARTRAIADRLRGLGVSDSQLAPQPLSSTQAEDVAYIEATLPENSCLLLGLWLALSPN